MTAPVDADEVSYDCRTLTLEVGDQYNPANARLDVAVNSVWALVFTIRMQ